MVCRIKQPPPPARRRVSLQSAMEVAVVRAAGERRDRKVQVRREAGGGAVRLIMLIPLMRASVGLRDGQEARLGFEEQNTLKE